ncbi:MAG TPA: carboxypeptidase regulatory-like domain-containing protein [Candidatus Sulfotelmatobacter sp.]
MFFRFRWFRLQAALRVTALFLVLPAGVAGQATSGLTGVVSDESGAIIVGAEVRLENSDTAFSATTVTNREGEYQFLHVAPGPHYRLRVSKDLFRATTLSDLGIGVGVTETRDVKLQIGNASESVEVRAAGEGTVNTIDASIGNVITSQQVAELPSLFRDDAGALLGLQPGVQVTGGDSQNGSVTGSRADATTVTLDGLDVNDETTGQAFHTVGRAPLDSVSEVRTIVGNADVSFGRGAGAQVDLVTKSGTNQWHGSASEFNRVSVMAANDFFNNLVGNPRAQLTRNQFGASVGGPILKDRLFFFFDYTGRRDATGAQQTLTVPLDPFRNGEISYVNDSSSNCPGATLSTQPSCISTLTTAQTAALDPLGIGADQALLGFIDGRYPEPNQVSGGDGINTGGFLFTAPSYVKDNTFVGRLDYKLSSTQNLFARGTWDRDNQTETPKVFPQDPGPVGSFVSHERSWVVGHTWIINPRVTNLASFGIARQVYDFPINYAPTAPYDLGFGVLSSPYGDIRSQGRNVPVPEIRDTLSWAKGRHTAQFGADIKPIRVNFYNVNDISFADIGLQSQITSLEPSLRPSDISTDPTSELIWDNTFTTLLGRYASVSGTYNYDVSGNPLPQFTPSVRNFRYSEYELFVQDAWKVRTDLTVSYGLRWNYHSVPYEVNGFQSVPTLSEPQLFNARQVAAAGGVNGFNASPFVSYQLGGPVNHGPGYYHPDWRNFAPRLGMAYSPSFTGGVLGHLLGDRKSSIRAGGGLAYDRVLSTLSFEVDETAQMFDSTISHEFGVPLDPVTSLQTDPRFHSVGAPVPPPPPGTVPRPSVTPFVVTSNGSNCPLSYPVPAGQPCATGLATNSDLFQLSNTLKMPYSITVSFGIQRELPGNFLLDVNYFGKFGRRLIGNGDPGQQLNFKDPQSGQLLNAAFGNVQAALNAGTPAGSIAIQPWFENQVNLALPNLYGPGATCQNVFGIDCTNFLASPSVLQPNFQTGDLSTVDVDLANAGFLLPNTGLPYQTGSVANVGNWASSSYNGLVATLRKRASHNLQFDLNYQYARSIDNVSDITNDAIFASFNAQGLICDLRNLRVCRASSDFDAVHTISANYVYQLPIGRRQWLLGSAPKWADAILGGWAASGIISYHSGFPFTTITNAFPIDFTMEAPAVLIGPSSAVKQHIHVQAGNQLQLFTDQTAAIGAFAYPFGGGTGERNQLRGPSYANVDMALLKSFRMPWSENQRLEFRAEAFNAFNHPSFNNPSVNPNSTGSFDSANVNIQDPGQYGVLTNTANAARQLQLGLRYDF